MSRAPTPTTVTTSTTNVLRFRIFVDFWNLQITLNERVAAAEKTPGARFDIDWRKLPTCLFDEAARIIGASSARYDGTIVYTSNDPKSPAGKNHRKWATTWLDIQPGIQVQCFERQRKKQPKCQACRKIIAECPHCHQPLAGTTEKGVDTAIATDMIRLAWESAYEVAVLASSDADLVPAVQFLDQRGFRILQAGFPPHGSHLSRACWATIDVFKLREHFRR